MMSSVNFNIMDPESDSTTENHETVHVVRNVQDVVNNIEDVVNSVEDFCQLLFDRSNMIDIRSFLTGSSVEIHHITSGLLCKLYEQQNAENWELDADAMCFREKRYAVRVGDSVPYWYGGPKVVHGKVCYGKIIRIYANELPNHKPGFAKIIKEDGENIKLFKFPTPQKITENFEFRAGKPNIEETEYNLLTSAKYNLLFGARPSSVVSSVLDATARQ